MFGKYRNLDDYIESLKHLAIYNEKYDDIYPMHGTIPVKKELISDLLEGAQEIKNTQASGTEVELFGNKVYLYKFPYAGFLYI